MMTESRYQLLAERAFRLLDDAFRDVDPDVIDCERSGDVLTLTFPNRVRCVINTQRPTRQIWVAANARAWHFGFDETKRRWFDDKSGNLELGQVVGRIVHENAGINIELHLVTE